MIKTKSETLADESCCCSFKQTQQYSHSLNNLSSFLKIFSHLLYLQLSAVIGATWVFAYLYIIFPDSLAVSYIYVILNSLQGVFIFLAFGITSRVRNMWREKYVSMTSQSKSVGTGSTPLKCGQAKSPNKGTHNDTTADSLSNLKKSKLANSNTAV